MSETIGLGTLPAGLIIEYKVINTDTDAVVQAYTSVGITEDTVTATESGYRINVTVIDAGVQFAVLWRDTTDTYSGYEIYDIFRTLRKPIFATVEGTGQTTTVFDTNLTLVTDQYKDMWIRINADTTTTSLRNQTGQIQSNNTGGQITLYSTDALTIAPAVGDTLEVF